MRFYALLICTPLLALLPHTGPGLPENIEKKVVREVERTFDVSDFRMESVKVEASVNSGLPVQIMPDHLFRLYHGQQLLGYAFVDKAPSKTASFDYLVLLDKDLKVVQSKILVYREEYGGEIGSSRWLRQFRGKSGNDRVSTDTNIDGISGATISVRSMTRSMDNLFQTIGKLQELNLLQ